MVAISCKGHEICSVNTLHIYIHTHYILASTMSYIVLLHSVCSAPDRIWDILYVVGSDRLVGGLLLCG